MEGGEARNQSSERDGFMNNGSGASVIDTSPIGEVGEVVTLLRAREVAEHLAISVWHLDDLRRRGLIKAVQVGQRSHRYHPADVAEFIRCRRG